MSSPLDLLDAPPDIEDEELSRSWARDVARSLGAHPSAWQREAEAGSLSAERAWSLLGSVELLASSIAVEQDPALVRHAAFALALLGASPLDRREAMLVAGLVRRAAARGGLDFPDLAREGCCLAGELGERCLPWLSGVSPELPATHEETGDGASFRFRRRPSTVDVDRLTRWLDGDR